MRTGCSTSTPEGESEPELSFTRLISRAWCHPPRPVEHSSALSFEKGIWMGERVRRTASSSPDRSHERRAGRQTQSTTRWPNSPLSTTFATATPSPDLSPRLTAIPSFGLLHTVYVLDGIRTVQTFRLICAIARGNATYSFRWFKLVSVRLHDRDKYRIERDEMATRKGLGMRARSQGRYVMIKKG